MSNFSMKLTSAMGVATLVVAATSASLVSAASEFLPYAEVLATNSVIGTQSSESGYRLGDNITRAELAKVVANLGDIAATECVGTFSDVSSSLGDLCGAIEGLADAGVVSTASATFRPNANVTRAEMTKMILGALGETGSDVDAGYMDVAGLGDLATYINRANEIGCASDASYFRPNASSSRGEAFKIAACVAQLDVGTTPVVPPTSTGTTSTGTVVAGALTVALDGTAVAQYVPMNASAVKVGSVKLTAGTSDVTVSSIVVSRSGLGNVSGISSLVLAQNGMNISDSRTMSTSSQTASLKLSPALVVKAGTSQSVDVLVNLANPGISNDQHQFTVTAVNAINATTSGSPVTLGLINTTSYTVADITVGGVTSSSVTSGKSNQLFATAKFTPNKAASVKGFTLSKSTGEDFTKVFSNVSAYFNGTKVGTVTITSDKIYVTGLDIARQSGEEASVELRGDVVYVGPASTTTFYVAESTDVAAVEQSTGYATTVKNTPSAIASVTLNAVDITITKTSTGSKTVAPGTSSVELYNANITSDATFDVSKFNLALTTAPSNGLANFTDGKVTVYVNGQDYEITSVPKNWTSTSDRFRVEPGTKVNIRVVGNVNSSAAVVPADYVFTFGITEVKNVSNGNVATVTKTQAGDKVTVKNGTVVLKDATIAPASTRTVFANADVEIGRFAVAAEADNVIVRKLTLTNAASATPLADFTSVISSNSVKLVDVATNASVSATVTVTAGSIVFESMSEEVTKDTTRNFKVVASTSGFDSTVHGKKIDLAVALNTVDKKSGGSATANPGTLASVASTDYTVGVVPPTVTLVKKSANVFLVTIANTDSTSDITLNSITAQVKPVATNNSTYTANFCLRTEGATDKCSDATITSGNGAVPGAATVLTVSPAATVSKNSSITREIYVDSNYVDPIDLLAEISKLSYNSVTESYSVSAK